MRKRKHCLLKMVKKGEHRSASAIAATVQGNAANYQGRAVTSASGAHGEQFKLGHKGGKYSKFTSEKGKKGKSLEKEFPKSGYKFVRTSYVTVYEKSRKEIENEERNRQRFKKAWDAAGGKGNGAAGRANARENLKYL